ncbi:MAG: hypothetical protein IT372_40180 [Polyangiaceae bacterium]|nr:hypothetical protein [Polyangiaceae bacterium]
MTRSERQPAAFYLLLSVSAWERFLYYGFRSVLYVVLADRLDPSGADRTALYSTVFAVAMLTPVLGGYVADRFLGHRRAILAGAILMALGAGAMVVELAVAGGVGLVMMGSGLIRPSGLALLGDIYRRGDARRDAGFTFHYAAVNAAALAASLLLPLLGMGPAGTAGLAMISAGMVAGAVAFAAAQRVLRADGFPASEESAPSATLDARDARDVGVAVAALGALTFGVVAAWPAISPIWSPLPTALKGLALLALIGAGFGVERARAGKDARPLGPVAWQRIGVLAIVTAIAAGWWIAAELQSEALSRFVFANISSGDLPTWLFSLNPVAILIAAPCFAIVWRKLDAADKPRSSLVKMGAGLIVVAVSVAITALAGSTSMPPLLLAGVVGAIGEVCFEPIAIAMVTKLAPARSVAFSVAMFFAVPALLSSLWRGAGARADGAGPGTTTALVIAGVCAAAGAALLVLTPALKRLMHGAEDPEAGRAPGDPYRSGGEAAPGAGAQVAAPDQQALASRQMLTGALWAIGGTVVTVASFSAASGGGQYVVAYGAIIYGVITFIRGLANSGSSRGS